MTQTRFTCTLTQADEPACPSYARVTIADSEGDRSSRLSSARCRRARRHHRRPR